jgi:hypothetical protein
MSILQTIPTGKLLAQMLKNRRWLMQLEFWIKMNGLGRRFRRLNPLLGLELNLVSLILCFLHVPVEQGEIPIRLEKATAYLALHLVKYPTVTKGYDVTYDSISIGPISLSNSDAGRSSSPQTPLVPTEVSMLIQPLIFSQGYTAPGGWWRAN